MHDKRMFARQSYMVYVENEHEKLIILSNK